MSNLICIQTVLYIKIDNNTQRIKRCETHNSDHYPQYSTKYFN